MVIYSTDLYQLCIRKLKTPMYKLSKSFKKLGADIPHLPQAIDDGHTETVASILAPLPREKGVKAILQNYGMKSSPLSRAEKHPETLGFMLQYLVSTIDQENLDSHSAVIQALQINGLKLALPLWVHAHFHNWGSLKTKMEGSGHGANITRFKTLLAESVNLDAVEASLKETFPYSLRLTLAALRNAIPLSKTERDGFFLLMLIRLRPNNLLQAIPREVMFLIMDAASLDEGYKLLSPSQGGYKQLHNPAMVFVLQSKTELLEPCSTPPSGGHMPAPA